MQMQPLVVTCLLYLIPSTNGWDYQCSFCQYAARTLISYSWQGESESAALELVVDTCTYLNIYPETVCQGMVHSVGSRLFDILRISNNSLTSGDICGMVLGSGCSQGASRPTDWALDIPELDKVPPYAPPPASSGGPVTRILQLSDLHIQANYSIGSPTECDYPLCCTADLEASDPRDPGAGHWGAYTCDTPPWTLDSTLAHIKDTQPDLDMIILTGDLPAHDIWLQTQDYNLGTIKIVADALKKYFPGIPVLPAIGNHEGYPVNMFPDPTKKSEESPNWLFTSMAKYFSHWLPKDQREMMSKTGSYSYQVRPNLTILSVNSNFCNNYNLWLLPWPEDPAGQLAWLAKELARAESSGSLVYIISHIPPGLSNCLGAWSHQYARIVERFSNIIRGQFYGHTHYDEFSVLFNNQSEPISLAYMAPSLTPHDGLNPGYRVYLTDSSGPEATHVVMDFQNYYIDLDEANSLSTAGLSYRLGYSALSDLGLSRLSPRAWSDYINTLVTDTGEWNRFYQRYSRNGPMSQETCSQDCREMTMCRLLTFDSSNLEHCDAIRKLLRQSNGEKENDVWWDEDF